MDIKEVYWSFLNESTGQSADGLTYSQAKFIAELIHPSVRYLWLVWHEGLKEWTSLESFEALIGGAGGASRKSPPLPPPRSNEKTVEDPFLNVEKRVAVDHRLARRFVKHYEIEVLSSTGEAFKTKTENVSMAGILLQEAVPDSFSKSFGVTLTRHDGSKLKMFCALVVAKKESASRKRLKILGTDQEGLLRSWLLDGSLY